MRNVQEISVWYGFVSGRKKTPFSRANLENIIWPISLQFHFRFVLGWMVFLAF
jgi:hypothetical protein